MDVVSFRIYIIYNMYNTCCLRMKPQLWDVKKCSANAHALRISSVDPGSSTDAAP